MEPITFTKEELEAALARIAKRNTHNKAWRERNPERVKAFQKAWRMKRDARDRAIINASKATETAEA